jgi:hypothetical protein
LTALLRLGHVFGIGIPALVAFRHCGLGLLNAPGVAQDCDTIEVAYSGPDTTRVDSLIYGRQRLIGLSVDGQFRCLVHGFYIADLETAG